MLVTVENPGIKGLQDCIVELVKAEQRVKTFTDSVNELKRSWKEGNLDESVDVVEVIYIENMLLNIRI